MVSGGGGGGGGWEGWVVVVVTQGEGLVIAVWQKCVAESLLYGRNVLRSHCCVDGQNCIANLRRWP